MLLLQRERKCSVSPGLVWLAAAGLARAVEAAELRGPQRRRGSGRKYSAVLGRRDGQSDKSCSELCKFSPSSPKAPASPDGGRVVGAGGGGLDWCCRMLLLGAPNLCTLSNTAYLSSCLRPGLLGGGGRKGAVENSLTAGFWFMTATGFLSVLPATPSCCCCCCCICCCICCCCCCCGWGDIDKCSGIMLSVWKLMGGLGAILSICWIPAWIALSSVWRPSRSSIALVFLFPPAGADGSATPPTPPAPPTAPRGAIVPPSGNEAALVVTLPGS